MKMQENNKYIKNTVQSTFFNFIFFQVSVNWCTKFILIFLKSLYPSININQYYNDAFIHSVLNKYTVNKINKK